MKGGLIPCIATLVTFFILIISASIFALNKKSRQDAGTFHIQLCVSFDCISVPALTKVVEVAKPICSDVSHFFCGGC